MLSPATGNLIFWPKLDVVGTRLVKWRMLNMAVMRRMARRAEREIFSTLVREAREGVLTSDSLDFLSVSRFALWVGFSGGCGVVFSPSGASGSMIFSALGVAVLVGLAFGSGAG